MNTPATTLSPVWLDAPELRRLFAVLGAPPVDVRAVGGSVRGAVLGRDTAGTEIDVGTPEPPERVIRRLKDEGIKAVPTGLEHGTVTAVIDGRPFEITSLRRDTACDGRHAAVEFTADWHEDARRRDFTMNAMSIGPDGMLHDDHEGFADARAGRVRFVGNPDDRIQEDYLRILRLFRFAALYGSEPVSAETLAACERHKEGLKRLSAERIRHEMMKLLSAVDPVPSLTQMQSCRVLALLLPECGGVDVLARLVAIEKIAGVADIDWVTRLGTLTLSDASQSVAERWRMSNADHDRLDGIVRSQASFPPSTETELRHALYHHGGAQVAAALLVAWARCAAIVPGEDPDAWLRLLSAAQAWTPHSLPVDGGDVVALGIAPGPAVGRVLAAMTEWWIAAGFAPTREEALVELSRVVKR